MWPLLNSAAGPALRLRAAAQIRSAGCPPPLLDNQPRPM